MCIRDRPKAGAPVEVDSDALEASGATVYFASIEQTDAGLKTLTSRTLAVLGEADTIQEAEQIATRGLDAIHADLHVRHDIGTPGLIERRIQHMKRIHEAS